MNMHKVLEIVGTIAGIGGLSIGMFLLLLRPLVENAPKKNITTEVLMKIIRTAFTLAVIGLVTYIISIVLRPQPGVTSYGAKGSINGFEFDSETITGYKPIDNDSIKELERRAERGDEEAQKRLKRKEAYSRYPPLYPEVVAILSYTGQMQEAVPLDSAIMHVANEFELPRDFIRHTWSRYIETSDQNLLRGYLFETVNGEDYIRYEPEE